MNQDTSINGIILAGGMSRRMKSEKGLVLFRGKPLVQYAIEALKPICDTIIISANTESYSNLGFPIIADQFQKIGPMGGIQAALSASSTELNFVLSCDMPYVSSDAIEAMIQMHDSKSKIMVPCHQADHFEPMCGVYKRSVLNEMEAFIRSGNFKLPDFYKTIDFQSISASEIKKLFHTDVFFNINSPEDLRNAPPF